jgi:hypothetical protein
MKRIAILSILATVLAGLAAVPSASAIKSGGFSLPTKRLESAYKIALFERRFSDDGCYPPPSALAKAISSGAGHKAAVAVNTRHLGRLNQVYVLKQGTNCDQIRMGLRAVGGIYVLDSRQGTVRLQGRRGEATPGIARRLTGLVLANRTFHLTKTDTAPRLFTLCPGGRYPLGGGIVTAPPTGGDGTGVYPHSNERLGAQRGWHISVVFFPGAGHGAPATARDVTVQALCGFGVIPATPTPHKTVYLRPGETKTVTARCPKGQFLVSGGFQRTDFRSDGGDYVTESRAQGTKAWTVSGHAYGTGSGELTAIAYCVRMKKPVISEVASSPAPVGANASATTATPTCPNGKRLVSGGFSLNGSTNAFYGGGEFKADGSFTANAYGFFGPVPQLTAYGYCLPAK